MPEASDRKYMSLEEFKDSGYLQEVNRRFLHPLGLALELGAATPDGVLYINGIWDCRDDPEGIRFAPPPPSVDKVMAVDAEWQTREPLRTAALGYMIQPPEEPSDE